MAASRRGCIQKDSVTQETMYCSRINSRQSRATSKATGHLLRGRGVLLGRWGLLVLWGYRS